ncbi:hypothetical protein ANN_14797 [Periplaneta americana]|uniref:Uncharacterized protein n=1 Tax=Periplaneta americana TaxID=6978 RepID=A0ABQ8SYE0_PERAM|nr:hypothetical protein ANN_14797 [Periplaneta americana]
MASLCEGGNEPPGSLKAIGVSEERTMLKLIRKMKRELAGSLAKKKLPAEGCTGRNGEREKSSRQKDQIYDIKIWMHGANWRRGCQTSLEHVTIRIKPRPSCSGGTIDESLLQPITIIAGARRRSELTLNLSGPTGGFAYGTPRKL